MTINNIAAIRKIADAAEPGPWAVVECPESDDNPNGWPLITVQSAVGMRREVVSVIEDDVASASDRPRENALFVAVARSLMPDLCDEIEQLRALLKAQTASQSSAIRKVDSVRDYIIAANNGDGLDAVELNDITTDLASVLVDLGCSAADLDEDATLARPVITVELPAEPVPA
ncbi:hypothetical protein [Micromonospora sp. NPDC050695]|uniref:hypothetical protein n=1 Tax=Micromonospora sp. NPDC050695 TaxID=3154938 RepID=UPI0033CA8685